MIHDPFADSILQNYYENFKIKAYNFFEQKFTEALFLQSSQGNVPLTPASPPPSSHIDLSRA